MPNVGGRTELVLKIARRPRLELFPLALRQFGNLLVLRAVFYLLLPAGGLLFFKPEAFLDAECALDGTCSRLTEVIAIAIE